ncbi:MAG: PQQ-binding-like beta-propeller repeat protein [Planctomycetaceae bacterium]
MSRPLLVARFLTITLAIGLGSFCTLADDWPQWRGANRDAVAQESGLLDDWTRPPALVWRTDHLGDGYSSVAVASRRVFTLGREGKQVNAVAIDDATGEILWTRPIGESDKNAMSTPAVAGDLVYVLDPDGDLACLKIDTGEPVWTRSLPTDFSGRLASARGHGESPLIDGDRLVVTPGGPDAMLAALGRRTGNVIWQAKIPAVGDKGKDGAGFSSIVISDGAGVRQYVQLTARGVIGVDADSGRFLWGYNDICTDLINIPTPVVHGDYVFASNGYNAGSVLLKLEPGGDTGVTATVVYRLRGTDFQNQHGCMVRIGDFLYGGHGNNNGLPTCLNFLTGKIVWKRRGPGTGSAAIAAAGDKLIFRYQDGVVALIEASPAGYKLRGTFQIPGAGGDSWSHPAIANGRLYLREQDHLWVHDLKRAAATDEQSTPVEEFTLSPELAALRALGVRTERLATSDARLAASQKRFRYFSYALPDNPPDYLTLVTLSEDHIDTAGRVTAEVIAWLEKLSEPCVLSASGTGLSDDGLAQLSQLESLIGLNVETCRELTDAGFEKLKSAKQLRVLIATGTAIGETGLTGLSAIPSLAALDLEVCDQITDACCDEIARLPELRALNLKKTAFEAERITDHGIESLTRLQKLESLNLYANQLSDTGLALLPRFSRLRELDLSLMGWSDAGLASLGKITSLRELRVLFAEGFAGPELTDAGMPQLLSLINLESLDLTGAKLTDAGLAELARLPQLRQLRAIKTRITPAGLELFQRQRPHCLVTSSLISPSK